MLNTSCGKNEPNFLGRIADLGLSKLFPRHCPLERGLHQCALYHLEGPSNDFPTLGSSHAPWQKRRSVLLPTFPSLHALLKLFWRLQAGWAVDQVLDFFLGKKIEEAELRAKSRENEGSWRLTFSKYTKSGENLGWQEYEWEDIHKIYNHPLF